MTPILEGLFFIGCFLAILWLLAAHEEKPEVGLVLPPSGAVVEKTLTPDERLDLMDQRLLRLEETVRAMGEERR